MTDTNRWEMLSKKEKLEVMDVPFGWMLRNILQYGNTLIPKKAIQKSSLRMIKSAIEQDLSDLGFEVRIKIIRYNAKEYKEEDHVAEVTFTGERRRNNYEKQKSVCNSILRSVCGDEYRSRYHYSSTWNSAVP